jgi:hypothetical protein
MWLWSILGRSFQKSMLYGPIPGPSASFWCIHPRFGANRGKSSVSLDRQSRWWSWSISVRWFEKSMLHGRIPRPSASFWCMQPRFGACSLVLVKLLVSLDKQSRWWSWSISVRWFQKSMLHSKVPRPSSSFWCVQPRFGAYICALDSQGSWWFCSISVR